MIMYICERKKCIHLKYIESVKSTYNLGPSPPAIVLKHLTSLPSTLYTTIPHSKLKDKLRELVQLCFMKKNGQRRYKYLVLGMDIYYFF
jgi:hypothetical protein